jgi:hypothetical protein
MHQLTRMASQSGRSVNLRCPYQANVMKTFDMRSKMMGSAREVGDDMGCSELSAEKTIALTETCND